MPKNALFLLKNRRALCFAPRTPLASGGWGFRLQIPGLVPPPMTNFWLRAWWWPSLTKDMQTAASVLECTEYTSGLNEEETKK